MSLVFIVLVVGLLVPATAAVAQPARAAAAADHAAWSPLSWFTALWADVSGLWSDLDETSLFEKDDPPPPPPEETGEGEEGPAIDPNGG